MSRLFVTQELVAAICASLYAECLLEQGDPGNASKEFRRTALVSTHFFHGMLPYTWGSVKLLDLFKRGLIPAQLTPEHNWVQVRVSKSISRKTMSRFHFYAPYIKALHLPIGSHMTAIDNWKPLAAYSKDNELLPNLVELDCGKFDLRAISVFLLPSTRKLTIGPPGGPREQLDTAKTKQLLEHTAKICPGLRFLKFHSGPAGRTDTPELSQTFALLSSFKDLRRLTSSPVVIQSEALQFVAQLPYLDTLSIGPCKGGTHWDSSLCEKVPADGFPALTDLTLHLDEPGDAMRFWELVPLGALKKLDLTLVAGDDESPFISTICRASPQIANLGLTFVEGEDEWTYPISADVFEHLACLPIESCSFNRATLEFEGAWAKIAGSWPNLRLFECHAQSADLEDLLALSSKLPKLETLECDLDLDYAADDIETNWSPVGQPSVYPQLRRLSFYKPDIGKIMRCGLEDRERESELRDLAKFLAYFWPKLSIETIKEDPEEEEDGFEREYYRTRAELLVCQDASYRLFKDLVEAYVQ
ncbi:hypothetical protein FRC06_011095, partial [Ceratobasidium sp. 370]